MLKLVLLSLHRSYFTKAVQDHTVNPMGSRYAQSFLSAYRTSLSMVKTVREHYELCPSLLLRSRNILKHVFTALV